MPAVSGQKGNSLAKDAIPEELDSIVFCFFFKFEVLKHFTYVFVCWTKTQGIVP